MGEAKRRRQQLEGWSDNLTRLHKREEELRRESIAFIKGSDDLTAHLEMIETAMSLLYHFAVEISGAESDDDRTVRLLAIRMFNAVATALKLCLSGYGQTAAAQARDILETIFLVQYFGSWPEKIAEWRLADDAMRKRKFKPVAIREALDKRDGFTTKKRAEAYDNLCRLAAHPTMDGFAMLRPKGTSDAQIGPFFEERSLIGVIEELAKLMAQVSPAIPKLLAGNDNSIATMRARLVGLEVSSAWLTRFFNAPSRTAQIAELRLLLRRMEAQADR